MRSLWGIAVAALGVFSSLGESYLVGVPTVPFNVSAPEQKYSLKNLRAIVVDLRHLAAVDNDGLTLIPPTLWSFAETFRSDLADLGLNIPVLPGLVALDHTLFLTLSDQAHEFLDAAGRPTSEGYEIKVTTESITLAGASPLGAWWGTRTVLQQAVLNDLEIPVGQGIDAPGWSERGLMIDMGRHYYPPEFIIEMCAYLSYFKQNVFHLHLSDHVWNPANLGSHELALQLYAGFRPYVDDPTIAGLPRPMNETYNVAVMDNFQQACASRGVTIIPELESPGHSIATTDWKPELALADFSMLNISYPETIPAVKSYWKALLPHFHSKIVHIGADEYDSSLVNDYTNFVNTMSEYIKQESGKSTRIWGTFPPSSAAKATNVNPDVSIQQWDIGQDNALFDFVDRGYHVLNADDYFYLDLKHSEGGYPPELDTSYVFFGAPDGGPYAPYMFDHTNATNNPPRNNPLVLGQSATVWNDWGPNASTYNEAYWMVRNGLPALGDKQWGGQITLPEYDEVFPALQAAVPAQNLDRRIQSKTSTIVSYDFQNVHGNNVPDKSGNAYNGKFVGDAKIEKSALALNGNGYLLTPLGSKGRNYTLTFSVKSTTTRYGGALFSGPDSAFLNGNGTSPYLMLVSGNIAYPVNLTLPVNQWTDVEVQGIGPQTFISVTTPKSSKQTQEVTILMGIWGGGMLLGPMAIEAPIQKIGDGFVGQIKAISLKSDV